MDTIEKIQGYIRRTGVKYKDTTPYQMNLREMFALTHMAEEDLISTICLAFDYGRAKGERSARAAQRREVRA